MNESLTSAVCQDDYTDALTLGPEPGIMDGCDITIEAADVLMQFNIGPTGSNYWDDREYRMRPGTRHVDNICGVQFRNYVAGAQAVVTAALTGPAKPRLGPITPLSGAAIGDPILELVALNLGAGDQLFGPFDVGDWQSILLYLNQQTAGAGNGAKLSANYAMPSGVSLTQAVQVSRNNHVQLIVENVIEEVTIEVVGAGASIVDVLVSPCNLDRQLLRGAPVTGLLLHQAAQAVGAGATLQTVIPAFQGKAQTIFRGLTGGPYNVVLTALDYTGTAQTVLVDQEATQNFTIEHAVLPCTMQWSVTNTAGAAGTYNLDTVIKEPA